MAQGNPTSDFINDLPRNVLDCILERLPICDLVRTSILSRKWRYHWTTIPNLVFDLRFFEGIMAHDKAMNIVNRLLLLHSGPILKFVLHISSLYSENSTCSIDIDPWILFLSRNGIKEVTLCNLGSISHKLPSSIFSCQGLTHLKLSMGEFAPTPVFKGFQNITSLELRKVTFPAANMVETIISTSPLLERLKLDDCDGIDHLSIHTHNLKYLYVNGLESICFKQSPNLTEITIRSDLMLEDSENSKMSNLIQLFDAAPKIEKLFLEVNSLKFLAAGGVPDRISTPANQLKILMLSPINFSDFDLLSLTLCLIQSSPNLQKLEIGASACKKAVADLAIIFLESHWAEYSLEQLRIVKINLIGKITGRSRPELELIKILLARSPSLETLFIDRARMFNRRNVFLNDAKAELKMTRELAQFRRASTKAEIIFLNCEI